MIRLSGALDCQIQSKHFCVSNPAFTLASGEFVWEVTPFWFCDDLYKAFTSMTLSPSWIKVNRFHEEYNAGSESWRAHECRRWSPGRCGGWARASKTGGRTVLAGWLQKGFRHSRTNRSDVTCSYSLEHGGQVVLKLHFRSLRARSRKSWWLFLRQGWHRHRCLLGVYLWDILARGLPNRSFVQREDLCWWQATHPLGILDTSHNPVGSKAEKMGKSILTLGSARFCLGEDKRGPETSAFWSFCYDTESMKLVLTDRICIFVVIKECYSFRLVSLSWRKGPSVDTILATGLGFPQYALSWFNLGER